MVDPTQYRHFVVRGSLLVNGEVFSIFEPCYADDLSDGNAAKAELAEHVRERQGKVLGDAAARWKSVEVTEFAPPAQMWEGSREELWPL